MSADDPTREQRIRERAFKIWIEEGQPEGRSKEHWELAAREIEQEPHTDNVVPDPGDAKAGP